MIDLRLQTTAPARRRAALVSTLGALCAALALTSVTLAEDRDLGLETRVAGRTDTASARGDVVTLPAGSVDGLADAIAAAGPRGVVVVAGGEHVESGTVLIDIPVSIIGESGAILRSDTTPPDGTLPQVVEGALHVKDTENVVIEGLTMTPLVEGSSNTAILVENSPRVTIESNTIEGYTGGIVVQEGDRVDISGNTITLTGLDHGVVIVNGEFARITDNVISQTFFGIWACDKKGHARRNTTTDSFIGLILCKVPPSLEISGQVVGSEFSATEWHVQKNLAERNFWGYAVTDGATGNVLANNAASDNEFVDIEVLGDSMFFGFFTPTATDTVIAIGRHKDVTIHDCGVGTLTNGNANLIDAPCFP